MEKEHVITEKIHSFENIICSIYLLIMLGFFPVYYRYQYADMGDSKYKIFAYSTGVCVLIFFLLKTIEKFLKLKKESPVKREEEGKAGPSLLDKAVLIYILCTTISYLFCNFKEDGFFGSSGWNMGFLSQILFVAVYFMVSRGLNYRTGYLWLFMVSSAIVFLLGVLHRFDVDILGIYGDLALKYKILFLSTMGQSSWYSGFLCIVFPVGLYLFFIAKNKRIQVAAGACSVIAMCSLVTQNTDTAFLSLLAVIIFLFYLSFDGKKEKERFFAVLILIFASFTGVGICQRIFADRMIPLDSLSIFMSGSFLSPLLLAIFAVIYWRVKVSDKKEPALVQENPARKPFWVLIGLLGLAGAFVLIFIILNSTGFLYTHFGYQNVNNYLLFADDWGNARGFAWRFTCEAYAQQPFVQKLIGVGPDCYSFSIAEIPELTRQMQDFWGDLILTNAHNEYLTKLYNLGILGLLSYIMMLGSAIYIFMKKRKECILLPAFALCAVSYMTYLIFCYEQVCCTPFFYILMGIGSNLIHNKGKKSTY